MIKHRIFLAAAVAGLFVVPALASDRDRAGSAVMSDDPEPVGGGRIVNDNPDPFGASDDPEPILGIIGDDPDPFGWRIISDGPDPISGVVIDDPEPQCVVDGPEPFGAWIEGDPDIVHGVICVGRTSVVMVWVAQ